MCVNYEAWRRYVLREGVGDGGWLCVFLIAYHTVIALRGRHVAPAQANRNEISTTKTRSQPIVSLRRRSRVSHIRRTRRRILTEEGIDNRAEIKEISPPAAMLGFFFHKLKPKIVLVKNRKL